MTNDKFEINDKNVANLELSVANIVANYNKLLNTFNSFVNNAKKSNSGITFDDATKSETEIVFSFLGKLFRLTFSINKFISGSEPKGKISILLINGDNKDDTPISKALFSESGKVIKIDKHDYDSNSEYVFNITEEAHTKLVLILLLNNYIENQLLIPKGVDIATFVNY